MNTKTSQVFKISKKSISKLFVLQGPLTWTNCLSGPRRRKLKLFMYSELGCLHSR